MDVPGSPFGSATSSPPAVGRCCRHCHGLGGGRAESSGRCSGGGGSISMAQHEVMEEMVHNGSRAGPSFSDRRKRLRMDDEQESEMEQLQRVLSVRGRSFVPIRASPTTFHTETVKQTSETIYIPLSDDVLVNVRTSEQISYGAGVYFIGDHRGSYVRTSEGHVINLWRYSEMTQKLFISRSFLFLNVVDFVQIKEILENI
ncbi:uncharacterized protein [Diadema setosum]|uniref:uncharacterized protein n=1 Tax=Diadema setosum TaxID=31175 RepID=UPI003B3B8430